MELTRNGGEKKRQRTVPCLRVSVRGILLSSTNESTVMTNGGTSVEQKKRYPILSYIVIVVAVGLVVAGILNGGLIDVLEKAKKICMECIGLG